MGANVQLTTTGEESNETEMLSKYLNKHYGLQRFLTLFNLRNFNKEISKIF